MDRDRGPFDMMANFVKTFAGIAQTPSNDFTIAGPVSNRGIGWPLVFAAALLFVPPAIRFVLGSSSNTVGLVLVSLSIWAAALAGGTGFARGGFARWSFGLVLSITVVLIMHLGIAVAFPRVQQNIDIVRAGVSLVSLVVLAVMAGLVADWLATATSRQIDRIGDIIRVLLILIGLWSAIGFQPPSPFALSRPTFPFPEPSHHALVTAAFAIDGCVRAPLMKRFVWLAIWLGLALLNQSLSLIVAVAIAAAVRILPAQSVRRPEHSHKTLTARHPESI